MKFKMNDKEYTYDIDKYTIGVDENGEDGIGMTVAKIENGGIKFLGNCYGENARCIDLLIKENKELKKQLEEYKNPIKYFKYANKNVTEENKQLKDNWNKLKKFIVEEYYMYLPLEASTKSITILINKMQELEESDE